MIPYDKGCKDTRLWGTYEVTNVGVQNGEEFCEKEITINPFQALSLQRHMGRREIWTVLNGNLSVIINGKFQTLSAGEKAIIPNKAPHCMMNLTGKAVTVFEKQIGLCREDDNIRLFDYNGRETVAIDADDKDAIKSIQLYKEVTKQLSSHIPAWYDDKASNEN